MRSKNERSYGGIVNGGDTFFVTVQVGDLADADGFQSAQTTLAAVTVNLEN